MVVVTPRQGQGLFPLGDDVPAGAGAVVAFDRPPRRPPMSLAERLGSPEILVAGFVLALVARTYLTPSLPAPWLRTWSTVFVSVLVQALPFLVFGVVLSAVIAVFVPASFFARALPRRPALAVPVASVAGVALPGWVR
jgi:hypothetical protein